MAHFTMKLELHKDNTFRHCNPDDSKDSNNVSLHDSVQVPASNLYRSNLKEMAEHVLKLCRDYKIIAELVTMARRANAIVPAMPELDAAALERFEQMSISNVLEVESDVKAELKAFFYATLKAMREALTDEMLEYARKRVDALSERKQILLLKSKNLENLAGKEDTLLWRQIQEELQEIRTELDVRDKYVSFVRDNKRKRTHEAQAGQ